MVQNEGASLSAPAGVGAPSLCLETLHSARAMLVIPARMDSQRLPGKPLADLAGTPMVVRVAQAVSDVDGCVSVVASGDDEIVQVCAQHEIRTIRTATLAVNGTERVAMAVDSIGFRGPVVNVQGDEPFVDPAWIEQLVGVISPDCPIATLAAPLVTGRDDPHCVKVALDEYGNAVDFSREDHKGSDWQHIGVYAFAAGVISQLVSLPSTLGESVSRLEQLRWMAHGWPIHVVTVSRAPLSVDTPEELQAARVAFARGL